MVEHNPDEAPCVESAASPPPVSALAVPIPEVPPGIAASQAAFGRALPDLLKKRYGHWVAFHGEELVGFARSETDLYEECTRRGLPEDTFAVSLIMEEDFPPDTDCTPAFFI